MTSSTMNVPMELMLVPNFMARSLVSAHVESRKASRQEELRARRAGARAGWKAAAVVDVGGNGN